MPDPRMDTLLSEPDGEAALSVALTWLSASPWPRAILPDHIKIGSYADYARSLHDALAAKGLSEWAARFANFAGDPEGGGSLWTDPVVVALLDEAGLQVAAQGTHPQLFAAVDDVWGMSATQAGTPAETLIARLADARDDHPLVARLASRIAEISSLPPVRLSARRESRLRTRDLWPGPNELPIDRRWAFRVVSHLWPQRFMSMLDSTPAMLAHASVMACGPFDLVTLENLLDDHNVPGGGASGQPESPAVFALLAEVAPLVAERVGTSGKPAATAAIQPLLARLASRSDWPWLSRAWLQQLIWHASERLPRRLKEGSDWPAARSLLIDALAASAPPISAGVQEWIMEEEPLWRVDRVLAETAILTARGAHGEAGKLLSSGIVLRQVTQTARDQAIWTGRPEANIVGTAIANVADPVAWFTQLWEQTYEARERAWFSHTDSYESPADPALAWGLTGLNSVANRVVQNSYWQAMSEALVERIVTDPRSDVPSDLRDIIYRATLFVGTRLHFGGIITLDDLARVVSPLIQPTPGFLRIVSTILAADGERLIPDLSQTAGCRAFTECLSRALAVELGPSDQITPELIASLRALLKHLRSSG
ncbi:hypothetical protein [Sphingobium sp. CAP-1]|uniref:hypothetical protein n=1 Tax=Sphingobium sp. CAP-1 TaxID=2676077 RepID=UPI0012BB2B6E|nr:hypothetical protein [Sphingobium sp. CAP-1]QGP79370.1 hypothetical protein GL174_10535 [Sphingobium sp. CAP-1]